MGIIIELFSDSMEITSGLPRPLHEIVAVLLTTLHCINYSWLMVGFFFMSMLLDVMAVFRFAAFILLPWVPYHGGIEDMPLWLGIFGTQHLLWFILCACAGWGTKNHN